MKREKKMPALLAGLMMLLLTGSAVAIYFVPGMNVFFLAFYGVLYLLLFVLGRRIPPAMIAYSRILLGLLFIYSGFVKGVDPLGTMYRVEDYYIAYGFGESVMPFAIYQSFLMNALEFVLGISLLFKLKPKLVTVLTALMMLVFTFATYMDAMYNTVPDCGCFGEALIISNWQTFYKNLTIDAFILVLLFGMRKSKPFFFPRVEWNMMVISALLFLGFEYYNYHYLPVIDFRDYKVGNRLLPENPQPVSYYLVYQNKETGEKKEYLSKDLPWDDEQWMSQWAFVEQRVDDPNPPMGLAFEDASGNEVTDAYIASPDPLFLLISWDLEKFKTKSMEQVLQFAHSCQQEGVSFVLLTGSDEAEIASFKAKTGLDVEVFRADDIELKTVVRSNPGLVLLRDSQVLGKWPWSRLPSFHQAKTLYD
ncbi:MAG: hypothetical protein CSA04_05625 [Bacteroidetes bacterium]|nr:MAG: hypothetical protein CSA04_05625 [Bacteroidota bacterium]